MKDMEKRVLENKCMDEERAMYACENMILRNCRFDGPADGESALKEGRDFEVDHCFFNLRYPFWHDHYIAIRDSELTPLCRAALWYTDHATIENTKLHGIKALRECRDITVKGCDIVSPEFGWSVNNMTMEDTTAESEYFMMRSENLHLKNVKFTGKYSFQYVKNAVMEHCVFQTKDAFWHSEHITVIDSEVNGEYLGWYSDHLTLIRCRITGTQPLCYCQNLKLIDCEMVGTDLAFERSDVNATLTAPIDSIKNPHVGRIEVPSVGEVILDEAEALKKRCEIVVTGQA